MTKRFLSISLIASTFTVLLPTHAFAATLYAAGSLQDGLTEVGKSFTQKYGIPIETVFGPSGTDRERIEQEITQGKKTADVFASADMGNPQKLFNEGLSNPVVNFTNNAMTLIVSPRVKSLCTADKILSCLLNPAVKLGTSTPISDPAGDYAQEIFTKADKIQPGSFDILNKKALRLVGGPNSPTVPTGENSLVYFLQQTQQADVFLAYLTSGLSATKVDPSLDVLQLPTNLAVSSQYGLTVVKGADPDGQKLADYILSPTGQEILKKYGFTSPTTSIPESSGIGGIVLGAGVAFALKKKLATRKKQKIGGGDGRIPAPLGHHFTQV